MSFTARAPETHAHIEKMQMQWHCVVICRYCRGNCSCGILLTLNLVISCPTFVSTDAARSLQYGHSARERLVPKVVQEMRLKQYAGGFSGDLLYSWDPCKLTPLFMLQVCHRGRDPIRPRNEPPNQRPERKSSRGWEPSTIHTPRTANASATCCSPLCRRV